MKTEQNTIVALSTANLESAIAIIRVSGQRSIDICGEFFVGKKMLKDVKSGRIVLGKFVVEQRFIDEVLLTIFRSPHSYTGENMVEISCHGSVYITEQILEALLGKARLATKGEFTKRAFINGKMDLTKAEAVGDLISAKTAKSHLLAVNQYNGILFDKIEIILQKLTDNRAKLELEIDFLEQGLEKLNILEFKKDLQDISWILKKTIETAQKGIIVKEGFKVALVGPPNVGKSSIFNALLKSTRAIVTSVAGTTRDYLEEAISLDGYLFRIFDTAGIRQTESSVERLGIQKSFQIIKKAHLVINLSDLDSSFVNLNKEISEEKIVNVSSKADLLTKEQKIQKKEVGLLLCSAFAKDGLEELEKLLLTRVRVCKDIFDSGMINNVRHMACIKLCIEQLDKALITINDDAGYEFTAFEMSLASRALEELIGKVTDEDILHNIFANFCIGK